MVKRNRFQIQKFTFDAQNSLFNHPLKQLIQIKIGYLQ